ncbi:hypothetical protein NPIL_433901 [Nephila pilipes]|uniref:Uncharacterized protein n=1 Tax=Nephila pilipes TaxID=299642 RepID=A0A8X6UIR1_NEPPI|nr:hypothetical protein NPIL_433901 [Nephila pilipes]
MKERTAAGYKVRSSPRINLEGNALVMGKEIKLEHDNDAILSVIPLFRRVAVLFSLGVSNYYDLVSRASLINDAMIEC